MPNVPFRFKKCTCGCWHCQLTIDQDGIHKWEGNVCIDWLLQHVLHLLSHLAKVWWGSFDKNAFFLAWTLECLLDVLFYECTICPNRTLLIWFSLLISGKKSILKQQCLLFLVIKGTGFYWDLAWRESKQTTWMIASKITLSTAYAWTAFIRYQQF